MILAAIDQISEIKETFDSYKARKSKNGNIFWYFFKVSLPKNHSVEPRKVKFNICNITKSKTLYERVKIKLYQIEFQALRKKNKIQ